MSGPLDGMAAFAAVVEAESFSGAARRLGLSKSAVSRQIARLEDRLGARLLNRTTRRLSVTEVGLAYYEHAARAVAEAQEAELAVTRLHEVPRGTLTVNAPMSFGQLHLAPIIPDLLARYPELAIDLTFTDRIVDLVEEGFDVAIRIARLVDSSLIARKLAPARLVVCASPAYLAAHGRPETPSDLKEHNCLIYSYDPSPQEWIFEGTSGEARARVAGNFRANNGEAHQAAALAGLGIALTPSFIVGPDLASGALEELLPGYRPPAPSIYAIYPHSRHLSPKVRAFVDFLAERYAGTPYWEPGR